MTTTFEAYRLGDAVQLYTFSRNGSADPIFAVYYNLADDRADALGYARYVKDIEALRSGEWNPEDDNYPDLPCHPGENGRVEMLLEYRTTKKGAEDWRFGDERGFTLIETGEAN